MVARIRPAIRALARRRAYLLAMAGAGVALSLMLVVVMAVTALLLAVLPDAWPAGPLVVALAALAYLPLAAMALSLLSAGVRAFTVFAAEPMPSTPGGLVVLAVGLAVFFLGRRLRARRGVLGWLADPFGAAARIVLSRALPADHPLMALLQVAGIEPRRRPTRGAGLLALGVSLVALAVAVAAASVAPTLGPAALASWVGVTLWAAVLGAGVKGVLGGAWDRELMDRMASQTRATIGSVARAMGTSGSPPA
jgi:hypothetical protein